MCGVPIRYIQVLHALNISVVFAYSIAIYCYYTQSLNHYISLLTTRCRRGCVERQSIMSKRKFQEELARHVEEPFLPHLVPELEIKKKKQKLPPPPVVGRRPFLNMRLSWDGSLEIVVRTMLVRLGRLLRTLCGQYKILRGSSSRRELNLGLG